MSDLRTSGARRAVRAALAVVVLAGAALLPGPARARPERSVFRSQPLDWEESMKRGGKPPPLAFTLSWTFSGFRAPLAGDPAPAGSLLVASGQDGEIVALDPATGTVAWRVDLGEPLSVGPAGVSDTVYQATKSGRLVALDGARGGRTAWSVELGSEPTSPPVEAGGRLLVATAPALFSLDARDGRIVARRPLSGRPVTPPEPAPGSVLIGTEGGILLSFDPERLEPRWRRDMQYAITSPVLVAKRRLYLGLADRSVRCLRLKSGRQMWRARTGAIVAARPFVRAPYLYLLCYDDDIWVLNARNGHLALRSRLGHRLDANAALSEHHVFVVPYTEGALVGLALPGLQAVGQYNLDAAGEWFTTAPVMAADRIALGYGRNEGKVVALEVAQKKEERGPVMPGDRAPHP